MEFEGLGQKVNSWTKPPLLSKKHSLNIYSTHFEENVEQIITISFRMNNSSYKFGLKT